MKKTEKQLMTLGFRCGLTVAAVMGLIVVGSASADDDGALLNVRLLPEVTLTTRSVTLSQIAEIRGRDDLVGSAKMLTIGTDLSADATIVFRAWKIGELLAQAGFDPVRIKVLGSARCRVKLIAPDKDTRSNIRQGDATLPARMASTIAPPPSLEGQLRRLICEHLRTLPEKARIKITFNPSVKSLLAMTDPPYTFRITRKQPDSEWLGLLNFDIELMQDGQRRQKATILAKVEAHAPLLVVRRTINSKAAVSERDVQFAWREIRKSHSTFICDIASLKDRRAKRIIQPGVVLTADLFEALPLVKRGQLVTVIYRSGGLEIKTVGMAMQTGFKDQVITVRNELSKQTYRGRLVDAGEVLVEPDITVAQRQLARVCQEDRR